MKEAADSAQNRARFVFEAEITGNLEHPGVVPVYGKGQYDDGRPYYAMQFVRGDNLKTAADRFHKDRRLAADPAARKAESQKAFLTCYIFFHGGCSGKSLWKRAIWAAM